MTMKETQVSWSDLPTDILRVISKKLVRIKEFIRFGAVSHPWRSIYLETRHLLPRQPPLLMFSTSLGLDLEPRIFYDICEKKVTSLRLQPRPENYIFGGSSQGWLLAIPTSSSLTRIGYHLFYPFSSVNNKIQLPSKIDKLDGNKKDMVVRVVLSANPAFTPDFVVMGVYDKNTKLAFYKPGKTSCWTTLDSSELIQGIGDIIYYRDQFYIVDSLGSVWACDVTSDQNPRLSKVTPPVDDDYDGKKSYIVESSSGYLLQLRRTVRRWPVEFEVFQWDEIAVKWMAAEINNLCGQAFFIGFTTPISVSASYFPGCKSNCIYYIQKYNSYNSEPRLVVYNLEDKRSEIQYPIEIEDYAFYASAIFVEPTLHG